MPLLDRVTTLIRANLNDLVDKAEDPEKLLKQLLLDMQNQFMQVKTQVAIAIADQHLLQKKQAENLQAQSDWVRKAELAITRNEEDLARVALERSLTYENAARNFAQQIEDQSGQVQILRDALHRLEQKMTETKAKSELLVAQHRRARLAARAGTAQLQEFEGEALLQRAQWKVSEADALGRGLLAAAEPGAEQRFAALEKADRVEQLLAELKDRKGEERR
ncbi:MAG: PspA/IM30 family protein [Acidobacteriaceae bacterium]|nr:PspA/IM30 family protein [Acidobacteriaceae bacterium]MBV9032962.1 PspA/IM30 family protein [Acidobacteriaceae bacterium]MBV9676442.1 PspA/IM30 family protein [Acidobacteriaceae bacterium]